jgi:hypothetical protein
MSTKQQDRYWSLKLAQRDDCNLAATNLTNRQGDLNLAGISSHHVFHHIEENPYRWVTDLAGGSNPSSIFQRQALAAIQHSDAWFPILCSNTRQVVLSKGLSNSISDWNVLRFSNTQKQLFCFPSWWPPVIQHASAPSMWTEKGWTVWEPSTWHERNTWD